MNWHFLIIGVILAATTFAFLLGMNKITGLQRRLVVFLNFSAYVLNMIPMVVVHGLGGLMFGLFCTGVGMFIYYRTIGE